MNQFEQNTQMGSGLTRYRSAPSSYLTSLLSSEGGFGEEDFAELFNPRASSPETQVIFSRFMNSTGAAATPPLPPRKPENDDFIQPPPQKLQRHHSNDYSSASQMIFPTTHNSDADASYGKPFPPQIKMEGGGSLIRHSSSPAGLFANINFENEFKPMNYTSSPAMNSISEIESKGNADDDVDFITGLPWDGSPLLSDSYLNDQKKEAGNNRPKTTLLSHHLSLPKAAMEKLLEDSVPCKIRAKRGCATHPRSIAERVRRTKISERMRKLQELVPNMEKQTNTSDMLDLAVDYIKDLQRQVKVCHPSPLRFRVIKPSVAAQLDQMATDVAR
ncbi:hypothetical protein SASPL_102874 [Salvia splendens]|uniref:BHLH domain-containing protein n=1 Tax=Salvia splendens TaxID=180675 RepID=A0A8X8YY37_SALSN|nr:hypothetical protein SASPL_102874 [Salvia splendens]